MVVVKWFNTQDFIVALVLSIMNHELRTVTETWNVPGSWNTSALSCLYFFLLPFSFITTQLLHIYRAVVPAPQAVGQEKYWRGCNMQTQVGSLPLAVGSDSRNVRAPPLGDSLLPRQPQRGGCGKLLRIPRHLQEAVTTMPCLCLKKKQKKAKEKKEKEKLAPHMWPHLAVVKVQPPKITLH